MRLYSVFIDPRAIDVSMEKLKHCDWKETKGKSPIQDLRFACNDRSCSKLLSTGEWMIGIV